MIYLNNNSAKADLATLFLLPENSASLTQLLPTETATWITKVLYNHEKNLWVYQTEDQIIVYLRPHPKAADKHEDYRTLAAQAWQKMEELDVKNIIISGQATENQFLATAEGLVLASYRFSKYFSHSKKQQPKLNAVYINSKTIEQENVDALNNVLQSVFFVRDQVNEPGNILTASLFAERITEEATSAGVSVDVLNKKKIEALKMGGLLAVNQGSDEEPVFIVLEWKPENAVNKKPITLVGKGITFDTGGSNLKTDRNMEDMKEDMAGGATVAATICAVAKNHLPIHVVALIPATDNRISNRSFLPGDIITMHNGTTVEVGNTDAEGRLILADAISYADHFDPQLIISIATLTGSAQRVTGKHAMVGMGNDNKALQQLKTAGEEVFERVVELPFWDDYKTSLKSAIADLTNSGGAEGGAIIAGKFLEHFTKHPFIHLDIAGVAFSKKSEGWKPQGGTGVGVRLLYQFLKTMA
ncbi:MAG: leucyl aminopeptidase family protein [Bacteroidales bacterium]|nr:leucyl aminopeptidase family protein [Bacteroidales bacterium]